MRTSPLRGELVIAGLLVVGVVACGKSGSGGGSGTGGISSSGGDDGGGTSATGGHLGAGTGGALGSGGAGSGGVVAPGSGGRSGGRGGTASGTGGPASGAGGGVADAGAPSDAAGGPCTVGAWPAADPTLAGPYPTMMESNVGPAVGAGADGGPAVAFTMFRPKDLSQGGLCHPLITWGNGTGATPTLYKVLLNQLASHGFVVIASDSPNVAQGDPPPMVAGVTWVLAQNDDPTSELYQRIDTTHIGATGHSQGGFATTTAGGDSHILTIAPLCGASNQRNLHGPAMLYCGGMDTTVPCSTIQNTFNAITNQPVMLAEFLAADHASWISFRGTTPSPVEAAVTAWMRVHLMGDTALRSWFYGPSCKLCTDTAWSVMQKMMDQ
jgi:dienelactone hydrolase